MVEKLFLEIFAQQLEDHWSEYDLHLMEGRIQPEACRMFHTEYTENIQYYAVI